MASKAECSIIRPMAKFPENIWKDHFPSLSSSDSVFDSSTKEIEAVKETVKEMLMASAADPVQNLVFIDSLLRLGVSYHFETDIEKHLERIFYSHQNLVMGNESDLNSTSVVFRVFRQHGFKILCGVFDKFKGSDGKWKETVIEDARGMLSLYEAANLRVHGESILEEALAFTKANLKSLAMKSSPHLQKQITNALDQPLNKCPPRLAARNYISFYEGEESRNETLLMFAKLDFNRLQLLHQQEISHIARYKRKDFDSWQNLVDRFFDDFYCRFWKNYGFSSELFYARERYVELYTWINSLYFEPCYTRWRVIHTKAIVLVSIIDDTFDAYGTPQEHQCFINALKRWEIGALDELQGYTKVICKAVLDVFGEIDEEARKEGTSYGVPHAKDTLIGLLTNYQAEVKWYHDGYVPTFEEYMSVAMKTSTCQSLTTLSFMAMGSIARLEAFEWLQKDPGIMKAVDVIGRLINDISTHEFERQRGHCLSGVECYMEQHKLSEKAAVEDLEKMVEDAWKDMNEECMRPTAVRRDLLLRILNFARVTYFFYRHGDGYTFPEYVKDDVRPLFVDPIPI